MGILHWARNEPHRPAARSGGGSRRLPGAPPVVRDRFVLRSAAASSDLRAGLFPSDRGRPGILDLVLPSDRSAGPCRHHGIERPLEPVPLLLHRHVEGIEEAGPVAPPHPQDDAARGEPVEHRDLLGDLHRMPDGEQVRAGADPQAPGAGRHCGERKQRLGERYAVVEVEFGQPERIEAKRLHPLRLPRELVRRAGQTDVPRRHPEVKPPPLVAHETTPLPRRHHNRLGRALVARPPVYSIHGSARLAADRSGTASALPAGRRRAGLSRRTGTG